MKGGHAVAEQAEGSPITVDGCNDQSVIDEVEIHGENGRAPHRPGRHTRTGEVKRHIPPMVSARARREAEFADDLKEAVQRLLCGQPGFVRKLGETGQRFASNGIHGTRIECDAHADSGQPALRPFDTNEWSVG